MPRNPRNARPRGWSPRALVRKTARLDRLARQGRLDPPLISLADWEAFDANGQAIELAELVKRIGRG